MSLSPTNEVYEGYLFTGVCLSGGGVCLWSRGGSPPHTTLSGQTPLGSHPQQTPPWVDIPPTQCMLGYGQQAGGKHPTRMNSC